MVNRTIHLFLIPMPIALLCLLNILFFGVLHMPFFLNFIQALLSIVSFCVRDVLTFQLTDGEEILANCTHIIQYFVLMNIFFLRSSDSYYPFSFQFLAWDHLDIIYYLPCSPFHGSFVVTPQDILDVKWMEPQKNIPNLLIPSYFRDYAGPQCVHRHFRKTTYQKKFQQIQTV